MPRLVIPVDDPYVRRWQRSNNFELFHEWRKHFQRIVSNGQRRDAVLTLRAMVNSNRDYSWHGTFRDLANGCKDVVSLVLLRRSYNDIGPLPETGRQRIGAMADDYGVLTFEAFDARVAFSRLNEKQKSEVIDDILFLDDDELTGYLVETLDHYLQVEPFLEYQNFEVAIRAAGRLCELKAYGILTQNEWAGLTPIRSLWEQFIEIDKPGNGGVSIYARETLARVVGIVAFSDGNMARESLAMTENFYSIALFARSRIPTVATAAQDRLWEMSKRFDSDFSRRDVEMVLGTVLSGMSAGLKQSGA